MSIISLNSIRNVQIPTHSTVTIPMKQTGQCTTTTACILEMEINEKYSKPSASHVANSSFER